MQKENLEGQRFGLLTVLNQAENAEKKYAVHWMCMCDCGNITVVRADRLKSGGTRSCGCLRSRAAKATKWQKSVIDSKRHEDAVSIMRAVGMARNALSKAANALTAYHMLNSGGDSTPDLLDVVMDYVQEANCRHLYEAANVLDRYLQFAVDLGKTAHNEEKAAPVLAHPDGSKVECEVTSPTSTSHFNE